MNEKQVKLVELGLNIEAVLRKLQAANAPGSDLRCRELSLAVTHLEEGSHWLSALLADLGEVPTALEMNFLNTTPTGTGEIGAAQNA